MEVQSEHQVQFEQQQRQYSNLENFVKGHLPAEEPIGMTTRNHCSAEYARVAVAAIGDDGTIAERSRRYMIHRNMITNWERDGWIKDIFSWHGHVGQQYQGAEFRILQAKIGKLIFNQDVLEQSFER